MKHATLPVLAGLACLSAVPMASAAPDCGTTVSTGPIAFNHGIPVFELPTVVVTPDKEQSKPARIARDSKATRLNVPGDDAVPRPHGTASYTPIRVVER